MNQQGLELIKRNEGCRLKAYKCPAGIWTIGYGHTNGVKAGDVITSQQAEELLKQDLKWFEAEVTRRVKTYLNENQISALTSFAYNVGVGSYAKSTLLKYVNSECGEQAIRGEFSKWNKSNGKVLPGLTKRRKEEADLFYTPVIDNEIKCNIK